MRGTAPYVNKSETETNEARYGSSFEVFFSSKKVGFVYPVRQLLINWPLSRGYFGIWVAL